MRPFPWKEAIGFGLGVLRLPPASFWQMTPRELAYAIAAHQRPAAHAPTRENLAALIARYPDKKD